MPWHTPEDKTEQAFEDLFATVEYALDGMTVFKSFSGADRVEPSLEIECAECEPAIEGADTAHMSGNWLVSCTFRVRSHYNSENAAAAKSAHSDWAGEVQDRVLNTGIIADLNSVSYERDFYALSWHPGPRSRRVEDHSFVSEITGTLHMMPSRP